MKEHIIECKTFHFPFHRTPEKMGTPYKFAEFLISLLLNNFDRSGHNIRGFVLREVIISNFRKIFYEAKYLRKYSGFKRFEIKFQ